MKKIFIIFLIALTLTLFLINYHNTKKLETLIIKAQNDLDGLCVAIKKYNSLEDKWITKLKDLRGKYVNGMSGLDPWKNLYILDLNNEYLISKGPDGALNTSDDIKVSYYSKAILQNAKLETNITNETSEIKSGDVLHLYFNKNIELPTNKVIKLNDIFKKIDSKNKYAEQQTIEIYINEINSILETKINKFEWGINSKEILIKLPPEASGKFINGFNEIDLSETSSIFLEIIKYETHEIESNQIIKPVYGNYASGRSTITNYNNNEDLTLIKFINDLFGLKINELFHFKYINKFILYYFNFHSSIEFDRRNLNSEQINTIQKFLDHPELYFFIDSIGNLNFSIRIINVSNNELAKDSFEILKSMSNKNIYFDKFLLNNDNKNIKIIGFIDNSIRCFLLYNSFLCNINIYNNHYNVKIAENLYDIIDELIYLITRIITK